MESKEIKACLLDLDNTVYNYTNAHTPALTASLAWFQSQFNIDAQAAADAYKTSRSAINKELRGLAPSHSRLLYFKRMMETLSLSPLSKSLEAEEVYWSTFLNSMQLTNGIIDFFEAMKKSKIRIAIVTDLTTQIQLRKIAHLKIEQYIDAIATSEESGAEKPSELIYRLALRQLNLKDVNQAFVIGDNIDKDIDGALNLGMKCFWFTEHEPSDVVAKNGRSGVTAFNNFPDLTSAICAMAKKVR